MEKAPGFTPEGLIAEIRRNSNYPAGEWRELAATEPPDPVAVMTSLREALDAAEAFVLRMPTEKIGLLFLKDGQVVQPDPVRLEDYQTHAGRRRGQWLGSSEISNAMMERYRAKQPPIRPISAEPNPAPAAAPPEPFPNPRTLRT